MNVVAFASRKGGAGKSTLAAHLAVHLHRPTRPCLLIDDDPQGSLTLWNELRAERALPLKIVKRGTADIVKKAKRNGIEWILIDTPPNSSMSVVEAIEAATLVIIPCRPGLFDIDAVQETIALARQLIAEHGGQVPHDRDALEALPGVGRKTANVVLNIAFGEPTIAVDTHIFRVGNRTGLAVGKTPLDVEMKMMEVVPKRYLLHAHHWLILHGRYVCIARRPLCETCIIADLCKWPGKTVATLPAATR